VQKSRREQPSRLCPTYVQHIADCQRKHECCQAKRHTHSLTLAAAAKSLLIRQLDSIRVFPFAFVLLGKNLFEPVRLSLSASLVHDCGIVEDDKFLAAAVTPKSAH
jgi:hypothetical protein